MKRILFAPSDLMSDLIRYFHVEVGACGEMLLPASPSPMLVFFVTGASWIETAPGHWNPTPGAFVAGPLTRATRYRTAPGTSFVSAIVRPGQFSRLFDIPLQQLTDARWPLEALADAASRNALTDRLHEHTEPAQWVAQLAGWLVGQVAYREVAAGAAWHLPAHSIFDDPKTLARHSGLSLRQFQRRFLSTYGQSLRDMRRMARFIHALSDVMSRPVARGGLTRLSLDCGYFDQAHMVRDFVALAGVSPSRLALDDHRAPELATMRYERSELPLVLAMAPAPAL